jgi:hypothetical protein
MLLDGISPRGRFHASWRSAQLSGTGETVRLVPRKRLNGSLRRPSCKPSPIDADQTHSLWEKGGCGLASGIRRASTRQSVVDVRQMCERLGLDPEREMSTVMPDPVLSPSLVSVDCR